MASQTLAEASLNDEHILCHACASTPDGPADPLQCSAMILTRLPLMASKMMGSEGNAFGRQLCSKASSSMGLPTGCKAVRASRTDTSSPSLLWMMTSNLRGAPDDFLDRKLRAPLTFPWNIILLNAREIDSGDRLCSSTTWEMCLDAPPFC